MKKEKAIPDIHIGSIIKAKAAERGVTEVQLAKMIHCHFSNIHYLYKKKSVNTEQLWNISIALKYDFFTEIYGKNLPDEVVNRQDSGTTTIVISKDKISIEQNNGIVKTTEYNLHSEN